MRMIANAFFSHRVTLKKRYGLLLTQQNGTDRKFPQRAPTRGVKRKLEDDEQEGPANKKPRWDKANRQLKDSVKKGMLSRKRLP